MKRHDRYRRAGVAVVLTLTWLASGTILQAAAPSSLSTPLVHQLLEQQPEQSVGIVSSDRAVKVLEHPLHILWILLGDLRTEKRNIAHCAGANGLLHDTVPLHHRLLFTQVTSSDL